MPPTSTIHSLKLKKESYQAQYTSPWRSWRLKKAVQRLRAPFSFSSDSRLQIISKASLQSISLIWKRELVKYYLTWKCSLVTVTIFDTFKTFLSWTELFHISSISTPSHLQNLSNDVCKTSYWECCLGVENVFLWCSSA